MFPPGYWHPLEWPDSYWPHIIGQNVSDSPILGVSGVYLADSAIAGHGGSEFAKAALALVANLAQPMAQSPTAGQTGIKPAKAPIM